jgi:tetratricopeptide (TPR) repeat protein
MKSVFFRTPLYVLAVVALVLGLSACADKGRKAVGIMDSPEHHYNSGMKFVDEGELDKAMNEFNTALELRPEYGPGMAGKGLVMAMKGDKEGLELIDDGRGEAEGDKEELQCIIPEMRAYIALARQEIIDREDMVDDCESAFDDGKDIDEQNQELYYWMGEAYLQGLDFPKSQMMFAEAKSIGGPFDRKVEERWEFLQKAVRAAPVSMVGKRIALVDELTRADMAGLLVEELDVKRFYEEVDAQPEGFKAPKGTQMTMEDLYQKLGTQDVANHPLRGDIEQVIELGVEGLQPYPDHTFRPNEPMTKAEIALLYQGIIIRATGDASLATEYIGDTSRISDVSSDNYVFNAAMLCISKGLLNLDMRTNRFHPHDYVTGVDALLSIQRLKNELSVF